MTPRGTICAVLLVTQCLSAQSQIPDTNLYHQRETAINDAVAEEDYEKAAPLLEAQIGYLQKAGITDSLYKYLYNYGRSLWKTKDAATSVSRVEALLQDVFEQDPDTSHWLLALENMSHVYYETGESAKCAKVDRQYLELVSQYSRATAEQKSIGHYSVGFNELEAGRSAEAVYHFSKSIEVLDTSDIASVRRLVNGYNALGAGLWRQGDLLKAKATFRTCLRYIDRLEDEYVLLGNKSNCLGNLSLIHQDEGQLVTAREILLQAIEERKKALEIGTEPFQNDQHRRMLISNFRNLASIYLGMGDHSRALNIVEQVQKMQHDIYEPGHPGLALTDESFGSIYLGMGNLNKAEEYLRRYISFCNEYYGRESFITAEAYKRLGDILLAKENYPSAISTFSECMEMFAIISHQGTHHSLPGCYAQRSWCYQKLGQQDLALSDNQKVIDLLRQLRGDNDPKLGEAYIYRAKIYRESGQIQLAELNIDLALSVLRNYRNTLRNIHSPQFQDPVLFLPEAYYEKARIAGLRSVDAEVSEIAQHLDSAISILRDTKAIYEGEDAKIGLYGDHHKVFELAQDICFRQFQETGHQRYIDKMLALNEESRTLLLRRQLQGFGSVQFFGVPDSVAGQERTLLAQLNGRMPLNDSTVDYQQLERRYLEHSAFIQRNYPEYYQLRFQESTAQIDEIRSELLHDDHTLLQYIATDEKLYALIVTPDSSHLTELPADGIDHLINRFNYFTTQMEVESFAQVAVGLYRILIEPIEKQITTTNLLIVPDEQLFSINFETLIRPAQSAKPRYLIHDYNISYLLSATTAVHFNRLKHADEGGVLAFAPGFSDQLKQQYVDSITDTLYFDKTYLRYLQQPFAVKAAQNVAGIMAGHSFTGHDATERHFKEYASKYSIIHLGTHTQINNTSPMLSRLVLAKDPSAPGHKEDGYLHAYEIYNLPLRAELAVLTACETGVGTAHPTEGVLSLSQSFAYAGCPSIVMSLWQIDEKTSSGIIEAFYAHLSNGLSKSEALRQAKLAYLHDTNGELSAPYFWAGMVLVGNTDPVTEEPASLLWWIALLVLLFVLVGAFVRRRRKAAA